MDIKAKHLNGTPIKELCRQTGISRNTIRKIVRDEHPGVYTRTKQKKSVLADFEPIEGRAHSKPREKLQALTDDELLESARNPTKRDFIRRNTRTESLRDGNGRAHELKRRAGDPDSKISPEDLVPVIDETPDMSMFPDLE